jgi:hypothetical protein
VVASESAAAAAAAAAAGEGSEGAGGGEGGVSEARATALYRAMRSWVLSDHVCVRRSPIHGWGLFLKHDVARDAVLIEYAGEVVRQPTADRREIAYEEGARVTGRFNHMAGVGSAAASATSERVAAAGGEAAAALDQVDLPTVFQVPLSGDRRSDGSGSCYLFRLDDERIVDATLRGCAARFINHCCEPNCYSRVVVVDGEKRIGICAKKELRRGEECTYNYKFAIETDPALKIPCFCGAPSCWGTSEWKGGLRALRAANRCSSAVLPQDFLPPFPPNSPSRSELRLAVRRMPVRKRIDVFFL